MAEQGNDKEDLVSGATGGSAGSGGSAGTVATSPWEYPRSRLRLQTLIGEGNFGQVWKAEADDICGCQVKSPDGLSVFWFKLTLFSTF